MEADLNETVEVNLDNDRLVISYLDENDNPVVWEGRDMGGRWLNTWTCTSWSAPTTS